MKTKNENPSKDNLEIKRELEVVKELYFHTPFNKDLPARKQARRKTITGIYLKDGRILFGVSECSYKDPFSKKKGRMISSRRALSESKATIYTTTVKDETHLTEFFFECINDLGLWKIERRITPEAVSI